MGKGKSIRIHSDFHYVLCSYESSPIGGLMSEELTKRQSEILEFLKDYSEANGYPPTNQEIRTHFKFASPQTVVDHLQALKRKQAIRIQPRVSRGIEVLGSNGVPILGQIAAGSPIMAIENILGHLPFDGAKSGLIANFALQIKGDSMIEAGINDGDYVFVEKTTDVHEGEIVAVLLDGEGTVKTLKRSNGAYFLRPENQRYENIPLDQEREDIEIIGRVTGLFRQYG
jgi:repressor LexA